MILNTGTRLQCCHLAIPYIQQPSFLEPITHSCYDWLIHPIRLLLLMACPMDRGKPERFSAVPDQDDDLYYVLIAAIPLHSPLHNFWRWSYLHGHIPSACHTPVPNFPSSPAQTPPNDYRYSTDAIHQRGDHPSYQSYQMNLVHYHVLFPVVALTTLVHDSFDGHLLKEYVLTILLPRF